MKTNVILILLMLVVISIGCQKENDLDETQTNQLNFCQNSFIDSIQLMPDGALNFMSINAYSRGAKQLLTCSEKELDQWEKNIGFNSMRKTINHLIDNFYSLSSEDRQNLINQNSKLITLGEQGEIIPYIEAKYYRNFINTNGIVYVNGVKFEFTDQHIIFTPKHLTKSDKKPIAVKYWNKFPITKGSVIIPEDYLNDNTGRVSKMIYRVPNTDYEYWIESKYNLFRDNIVPIWQMAIDGGEKSGIYLYITLDYFVQFTLQQYKRNYYSFEYTAVRPTRELFMKNINYTIKVDIEDQSNLVGKPADFTGGTAYMINEYTTSVGQIKYSVKRNSYGLDWEKYNLKFFPITSLSYTVGNTEWPTLTYSVKYPKS